MVLFSVVAGVVTIIMGIAWVVEASRLRHVLSQVDALRDTMEDIIRHAEATGDDVVCGSAKAVIRSMDSMLHTNKFHRWQDKKN